MIIKHDNNDNDDDDDDDHSNICMIRREAIIKTPNRTEASIIRGISNADWKTIEKREGMYDPATLYYIVLYIYIYVHMYYVHIREAACRRVEQTLREEMGQQQVRRPPHK